MSDAGMMHTVVSKDGTPIAFEQYGVGPPLVLVHGGVCDRTYWAPVLSTLGQHFTVHTMDRRGRGGSGGSRTAESYAIDQEFADVAAVADAIDEPVHLLGHSYGGICALDAALQTGNLRTLVLYEPPLGLEGPAKIPEAFIGRLDTLIAEGELDRAVEVMMGELVGLPEEALAELRTDPAAWQPMVDTVPTLPRELRSVNAFTFDADRYRALGVPTVLLAGTLSPPDLHRGVHLVHDAIPDSRVVMMEGVDHEAVTTGPDVLTATLLDVLGGGAR
ncbi:alpha/beta fold hydrolase [Pseudonocardia sp. H11422]|uniref:alpha/beta fold hydrolase n=1 Tax=Pseudonocardia sp. H11422 TaxID=2835866 RepID=UPI001BDBB9C0|nr:alpha/beta hydrolase [Pseudonocardia sp. H11422]